MNASATTPVPRTFGQISKLQKMDLAGLRAEYERVFGKPTKSRNRKQLFAQIAKKLQAEPDDEKPETTSAKPMLTATFEPKRKRQAKGAKAGKTSGKSKKAETKKRQPKPIGARDPRLPKPGTTITKTYKGKTINVRVLEHGFECGGKEFRSLSAVAKHVTGAIWNGYLFFGLIPRQGKKS
ncbi:MAG TPA: DUF2924 domain-containing protein [Acidobacteriota bacterium]|nr:DUF2924 domain-containing protein [Acidobacteriota bacterium]